MARPLHRAYNRWCSLPRLRDCPSCSTKTAAHVARVFPSQAIARATHRLQYVAHRGRGKRLTPRRSDLRALAARRSPSPAVPRSLVYTPERNCEARASANNLPLRLPNLCASAGFANRASRSGCLAAPPPRPAPRLRPRLRHRCTGLPREWSRR